MILEFLFEPITLVRIEKMNIYKAYSQWHCRYSAKRICCHYYNIFLIIIFILTNQNLLDFVDIWKLSPCTMPLFYYELAVLDLNYYRTFQLWVSLDQWGWLCLQMCTQCHSLIKHSTPSGQFGTDMACAFLPPQPGRMDNALMHSPTAKTVLGNS